MSQDEELSRVWGHVVSTLESSPDITPRQIAFVRLARPLGLLDGTLLLAVGNDLTKDYLESRAFDRPVRREVRYCSLLDGPCWRALTPHARDACPGSSSISAA